MTVKVSGEMCSGEEEESHCEGEGGDLKPFALTLPALRGSERE
jgi:hypothetical protein